MQMKNKKSTDKTTIEDGRFRSPIFKAAHEGVTGLYKLGLVDKATMRHFDDSCLTSVEEFSADDIRALRTREKASQAILAKYLSVSVNTVGQWERGERHPSGAAAKLLTLVKQNGLDYIR
jgi:putative transcriptional regulator